jgi:hypothetical protein
MRSSSTPIRQTLSDLLSHDLDLMPGESREFDIGTQVVKLDGTDSGVTVISADHRAAVLRRQTDGRYVVTGVKAGHHPSEPLSSEDAIRAALRRLAR